MKMCLFKVGWLAEMETELLGGVGAGQGSSSASGWACRPARRQAPAGTRRLSDHTPCWPRANGKARPLSPAGGRPIRGQEGTGASHGEGRTRLTPG